MRERLQAKAQNSKVKFDADKLPPRANPLYDDQRGMGKGISSSGLSILQGNLGQRRRKGDRSDDESDSDGQGFGEMMQINSVAQQRPRDAGRQRVSPPAAP